MRALKRRTQFSDRWVDDARRGGKETGSLRTHTTRQYSTTTPQASSWTYTKVKTSHRAAPSLKSGTELTGRERSKVESHAMNAAASKSSFACCCWSAIQQSLPRRDCWERTSKGLSGRIKGRWVGFESNTRSPCSFREMTPKPLNAQHPVEHNLHQHYLCV